MKMWPNCSWSTLLTNQARGRASKRARERECCYSYVVVPKGLLTFVGSLYKAGAKTSSGTLVCRFERQNARKKKKKASLKKHFVLNSECRILSQEHDTVGKPQNSMASLAVTKTTANYLYDFRSSMNSGSLFQGLNSALPENPRKVNKPFGTTA